MLDGLVQQLFHTGAGGTRVRGDRRAHRRTARNWRRRAMLHRSASRSGSASLSRPGRQEWPAQPLAQAGGKGSTPERRIAVKALARLGTPAIQASPPGAAGRLGRGGGLHGGGGRGGSTRSSAGGVGRPVATSATARGPRQWQPDSAARRRVMAGTASSSGAIAARGRAPRRNVVGEPVAAAAGTGPQPQRPL